MPKLKTKSGAKKRFKVTGTGKVLAAHSGKRHGMIKRTKKQIRQLRGVDVVFKTDPFSDASRATRAMRYAALDAADTRTRCVRRVAGHDVGARAEVLTPRRDHGDPDALVLFGAHEGVRQRTDHVIGQRVAALRAIERHAQHDSVEHDVDAVGAAIVRHRRHLTSSILNVFRR